MVTKREKNPNLLVQETLKTEREGGGERERESEEEESYVPGFTT